MALRRHSITDVLAEAKRWAGSMLWNGPRTHVAVIELVGVSEIERADDCDLSSHPETDLQLKTTTREKEVNDGTLA